MFKGYRLFNIILVTGPQRSGTRIAARCITADTGHQYVDEQEFRVHDQALFDNLLATRRNVVIQCPAMAHTVHKYGARDDLIVIWMLRELYEIVASQERIGWEGNARELGKYKQTEGQSAVYKYAYWLAHQRKRIKFWKEIEYSSLTAHKLWLPPERRADFAPDQTLLSAARQ